MTIHEYMSINQKLINEFLVKNLPAASIIHEAMRYSMLAPGKRLRPILCLATYETLGGQEDCIIPIAASLELIHTFSLIHDDLPALDNDDLRRGKPTSHKVFGEAMAILAGDALLNLAYDWLSKLEGLDAKTLLKIIHELAHAIGTDGLLGGQVVDIQSQGVAKNLTELEYIHSHKTGKLICAAIRMGALAAHSDHLEVLTCYGEKIGLAFQVIDDVLNVEGDKALLGKNIGSDAAIQKATFPALLGLEESKRYAHTLILEATDALKSFGREAWMLRELAQLIVSRKS